MLKFWILERAKESWHFLVCYDKQNWNSSKHSDDRWNEVHAVIVQLATVENDVLASVVD